VKTDTVLPDEENNLTYLFTDTLDCNSEYYWKVAAYNNNGDTESDVFSFTTEPCLGVNEETINIKIIPNPASTRFRVEMPFELLPDATVDLIDNAGINYKLDFQINGNTILFENIQDLPIGSYLLKVTNGKDIIIRKLIINR